MRLDERDREVEKLQTIIENVTKERDQLQTDHRDSSALKDSAIDNLSSRTRRLEEEILQCNQLTNASFLQSIF